MRTLRMLAWRWHHRRRAWVLRSKTYRTDSEVVGVYASKRAAQRYLACCTPPVADAVIEEWCVAS